MYSLRSYARGNVRVNNDKQWRSRQYVQNTKARGEVETARKRVHAQRDTIDKGPDGTSATCNEEVFRFRVCGADGHSYRFRVGKGRRRTGWQLDVRSDGRTWNGGGRGEKTGYERGSTKTPGVTSRIFGARRRVRNRRGEGARGRGGPRITRT